MINHIKQNFDVIFAALIIPIFVLIIIHLIKKGKEISNPAGIDYISFLICFNFGVVMFPEPFKRILFEDLKEFFGYFYATIIFIEILALLLWINIEKKLQKIHNYKIKRGFVDEVDLNIHLSVERKDFLLFLKHSFAWFLVFVFLFINISVLVL